MSNTEATTVKMPHIQLDASIHATAAILPGDPARVDAIAAFLTDVREEGFNREYKSITGTYKGRRILAISTGMGGPSTAICVEELSLIHIFINTVSSKISTRVNFRYNAVHAGK